jgi:hypothetical protein
MSALTDDQILELAALRFGIEAGGMRIFCDRDVVGFARALLGGSPNRFAPPPGFVVVPLQPTQVMCQAGQYKAREWPAFPLRIAPIWQAMIAAAPAGDA